MILSKRLQVIADMINENSSILDVGCDHGLLDIFLYKNKKNMKIIASDISEHSVEKAMKNADKYGVNNKIRFVLADGIKPFTGNYDYLVISGLGGKSIIDIFKDKDISNFKKIILQANKDNYKLRKYMTDNGFKIAEEINIFEKGKYYVTILFIPGNTKYSKDELLFGPILLKNKDEVFMKKYRSIYTKYRNIYKSIPKGRIIKRFKVYLELKKTKAIIKKNK